MAQESLITDEARAMIGMESEPVSHGPVTEQQIKRYTYAIDDLNPLYLDPEYAAKSRYGGVIAPPFFYSLGASAEERIVPLSQHASSGHAVVKRSGLPRPPLRKVYRFMMGGTEVEFFQPVRPGDVITHKSRLADIQQKGGGSGAFCLIITETTYINQRGELVVIDRSTGILR